LDIPRIFNITESAHRIHNPFTPESSPLSARRCVWKRDPSARPRQRSGEMLCTWARDYGVIGTGIDMSQLFTEQAKLRAEKLGVADQVKFIHGDAAGFVSDEKAGVAACLGATWIAGESSAHRASGAEPPPGGIISSASPTGGSYRRRKMLPGVSCWLNLRLSPASGTSRVFRPPRLRRRGNGFGRPRQLDRYEAAKWLTMHRWLEDNPTTSSRKMFEPN